MCSFAKEMKYIIKLLEGTELCIVGDIKMCLFQKTQHVVCYSDQKDCTN